MSENNRNSQIDQEVRFGRNGEGTQKIIKTLMETRDDINKYVEETEYEPGKNLKKALQEKEEETKITPAKFLSFLFVIPLLIYASKEAEKKSIQQKIEEEKERIKKVIDESIKNAGDNSMIEEMKKMSKQQKYDIMKAAMKEYSSKMSDSFKNMSDDELKRIVNNLDSNIQNCKSLDQLKIDASAAFVPNTQVVGQNVANNSLSNDKQTILQSAQTAQVNLSAAAVPNPYLVSQNQQQNAQYTVDLKQDDTLISAIKAAKRVGGIIDLSKNENKQIAIKVADVPNGQQFKFTTGYDSITVKGVKKDGKIQLF